jgi:hypothetical protein
VVVLDEKNEEVAVWRSFTLSTENTQGGGHSQI